MDSNHNLEHCMQRILDKFNMLDSRKEPKGRHANSAKKDGDKKNGRGRNGRDKDKDKKRGDNRQSNNTSSSGNRERKLTMEEIQSTPFYKKPEEFLKLSQPERDKLYEKIRAHLDKSKDKGKKKD